MRRGLILLQLKGQEQEWPNPKLNAENCLKSKKKKIKHPTLTNHSNFQKCEISVAHEMYFKHVFKISGGGGGGGGANSTLILWFNIFILYYPVEQVC